MTLSTEELEAIRRRTRAGIAFTSRKEAFIADLDCDALLAEVDHLRAGLALAREWSEKLMAESNVRPCLACDERIETADCTCWDAMELNDEIHAARDKFRAWLEKYDGR